MTSDHFSFEGLDTIEARLVRRAEDIGYIVVQDRTGSKKDETLGRFNFNDSDALPYVDDPLPPEPADDEELGDLEDAVRYDAGALRPGEPLPATVIAHAAGRWLRDVARRNTVGERVCRFRVKVWSPKGAFMVDSGQFVCRNQDPALDEDDEADVVRLRIPEPTFDEAATTGAAKGIRALGDYYAQWGQIVLGSVGQLQGVNNAMLGKLHRQLQESRDQIDNLVAAVLEHRFHMSKADDDRRADDRAGDSRHALAKEALQQIGEAAKAFLAAKGITPEMAEIVAALGQSQDLVGALTDPDVRVLMKDPENLKGLAAMLRQVAVQARVMREAATANVEAANSNPQAQSAAS